MKRPAIGCLIKRRGGGEGGVGVCSKEKNCEAAGLAPLLVRRWKKHKKQKRPPPYRNSGRVGGVVRVWQQRGRRRRRQLTESPQEEAGRHRRTCEGESAYE